MGSPCRTCNESSMVECSTTTVDLSGAACDNNSTANLGENAFAVLHQGQTDDKLL
uniref:Uncharacterized protein n=1 Tax=Arundo donax TaxID=35708 RepID=A0A0A9E8D6_ARUDO